jgi:membrane protein required for colicin V production
MPDTAPIITSFNTFDVGIVVFIGFSALIGIMRGFTKEILSIGAWAGASAVAFFLFPLLKPLTREFIGQPFISDVVTGLGLFIASLIAFSLFIHNISDAVKDSMLGGIDRSLGLLFGVTRAGLVLVVLFLLTGLVWKTPEKRPFLLQTSRTLPLIARSAEIVAHFIPAEYLSKETLKNLTKKIDRSPQELMFELANPAPTAINADTDQVSDYGNGQRRNMNRLFQNYAE